MAEDQHPARAIGGSAEQALVVGVAADDAVQDDDVGGLDALRVDCDVVQAPFGTILEPGLGEQPSRLASYAPTNSRFTVRSAPCLSNSIWISPTPPPISITVLPASPCAARKPTIRRDVRSSPRLR